MSERGLFQIFDRHVVEDITVEVITDDVDDRRPELGPLVIQLDKVHGLAGGFERFGEFGGEQFHELVLRRCAGTAHELGHLHHIFRGRVDSNVEAHADIGPDVVPTDQAVVAGLFDLDHLDADIHHLALVDDGDHERPGERYVDRASL